MLRRLLTTLFVVVAIAGLAQVASAQYMYLDSNANGVHDAGDRLNANGDTTRVDVYLDLLHNRNGSNVVCPVGGPVDLNSYVFWLQAVNGKVSYTNFTNQQATFTTAFAGPRDSTYFQDGRGGSTYLVPAVYKLASLTIKGGTGTPQINIIDQGVGGPEFTSFGTECDASQFGAGTMWLAGPNSPSPDWTDVDGLAVAAGAANNPPVLADPGNRTVPELTPLTFTLTATDPDAGQTILYSMDAGSPAGATVNGSTGAFAWTPTEAQGPGVFPITFRATDNATAPASATRPITVTVSEVNNAAPLVTNPGNKTTAELVNLAFTVATTADADVPPNAVTWSLDAGAPAGATIGAGTGAFSWTPTEAQGPGTFPVTIRATDNGTPVLAGTAAITITVSEANLAPVLAPIGAKSVTVATLLAFTATATDPDLPANTLTFSLDAGAPAGATIGAGTGVFNWTPAAAGSFPVTVRVTDNGTPALSGSEAITITVNAAANVAPVVTSPGNRTVAELSPLTFTVVATDANTGQTLTYSLDAGAPAGATINGSTGAFAWTPTEAQGPGSFPITIRATDNGTPVLSGTAAITVTVTEVNVAPVVTSPGNQVINELATLAFTVTATDADLPANTIAWSLDAGAPAGATIGAGTGAFSWTPTEAQGPGTFPVTIRATDNGTAPLSGTAAITITVNEVNQAPVVTSPGNRTVAELAALTFTVTATDADLPAQTIAWSLDAGAPAGAAIVAGTGAFSWTPTEAQGPGTFPITIRATDNGTAPLSGTAAITVTVTEVNVAPVVVSPGNRTTAELVNLAFTVTATDADVPANTIAWSLDAGAPAGATIGAGTGAFSWTPTEAQGPGTFPVTIRATDNGTAPLSGTAAITITVTEANVAPVLAAIGNKTGTVGAAITFTATATDADVPVNTLTFSLEAGAPAGATIGAATGAFTWTPAANGSFPVTVRVTDNGTPALFDNELITITVSPAPNQAPVLGVIGNKTVNELATLAFTATATDPNSGDVLTFSLDSGSPAGATINGSTGAFSWTPLELQGPGSFPITVRVTDNGSPSLNDFEAITVTVNEVNQAPVVTSPGNQTVNELATLAFTVTATDADIPSNTVNFSLDAGAPAGAAINAGTGAFSWTPTEAQGPGTFPVTIRATDNGTAPLSGTAAITITVNEVNQAPVVTSPGNRTVAELAALTFTVTATDADLPAQTIAWSLDAGAPAGAAIVAGTGAFSWTPTEAQGPGTFPITIRATDNGTAPLSGTAAITVTVTEVNVAPVVTSPGNRTTAELVNLAFTVTATDADVPANTIAWSLDAGAPAGATIGAGTGAFSWTPTEAQGPGTFPVTIRATDNGTAPLSGTAAITITVTEANVAPVLNTIGNKAGTVGVAITFTATATDADVPVNTLTFSLEAGAPAGATIGASTGAFAWTPAANGTFPVTVRVTDNGTPALFDNELITITVSAAPNQAPTVTNPGNKTVAELSPLTFTVTATDPNAGDVLTFSLDAGAPAGAAIVGGTGAFSWTPTEAQGPGTFPITIRATDNGTPALSGSTAITVTVTEVNVAPVVTSPGNRTTAELVNLAFTVTATDADVPANTIAWSLDAGAPAGATIGAGTGAFSWTPTEAQGPGTFPVTIRATDNGTAPLSGTAAITITVTEANVAPVLAAIGNKTVNELATLAFTATATDADLPANTLAFSLDAGAPAGATINAGTGAFSWTPTEAQGPAATPITVRVTDNGTPALSASELITVTVNEVNVAPVVTSPGNKTTAELVNLAFTVTATDADVPANTIAWSLDAGAPAGATIGAGTGAFSWTPTEAQGPGTFPVTIRATDNGTAPLSGTAAITITVTEANVAPVLAVIGNKTGTVGVAITFTATATDADVPANTLTFSLEAGAPAGATIGAATGAFTWTPAANGTFPVTVRVTDNGTPALFDNEAISIVVSAAPNQAPVLGAIGNKTVAELATLAFTATATDPNSGDVLTFSLDSGSPAGATINGSTGAFSWTPLELQGPGSFPITVRVTDNGSPNLNDFEAITVTVTEVNVAPVVTSPGNKTTAELANLAFTVTATDADIPSNTVNFSLDAGAPAGAAINAGTGAFSWTPTEAQGPGTFPVTIRATDNGTPALSGTAAITITVTEVNVAPVLATIGNKAGTVGVAITFTATATDADIPANTLAFSLDAGAPAGAAINASTGAFSWTPAANGSFPVTVRVTDNGTPVLSASELITITVSAAPNQAPVLGAIGNKTVAELATLAFTATATDPNSGDVQTFSLDAGAPAGATIGASSGAFSWTPTEAQGPASTPITIRVTDNGSPALSDFEAITVTVTEVNVAPVVTSPGNKTINELVALTFTVTATDADVPANTISWSLDAGAPAGATIGAGTGAFSWTPTEAQGPGTYPVTIRATDNGTAPLSGTAAITITVNEVNVAPVLAAIGNKSGTVGVAITFTATATDADIPANTRSFSLDAGNPAGSTINASTGAFSWTPVANGSFPVVVRVTDNGTPALSASELITITVSAAPNQAPVLGAIGNKTVNELATLAFTATATDPDAGSVLTFSLDAGSPAGATIGGSSGAFSWTPAESQGPGAYPTTVRVTDNGSPALSDFETITITVNEVNVAPVVASPGNKTVDELSALSTTITATDADLPAQTIAWSVDAGGPAGLTINASTGVASWTPTEAQGPGVYPVTFRATDNGTPAMSGSATITITVNEVNVAPVLANITNKTIAQGSLLAFTATATDADIPANTLTFSLDAGAPVGAAITAGGAFSWTPPAAGSFPITARVTDNGVPVLSASQTFTVTVTNVNSAPVLTQPSNMTVNEGATADQTLTATDPDAGSVLTFSKVSGPVFMTVSGAGVVHLAPGSTDAGVYPASVKVSDNGSPSLSDTKSFQITVNETNRAPVANAGGPYTGNVGGTINFNGSGSSDPDGDALTYAWNFGDGGTGTGVTVGHAYAATGVYTVTLRVTDPGLLYGDASTTATVADFFAASVFFYKNLNYMFPQILGSYIRMEPIAGSFNVNDVLLSSLKVTYNGVSKMAACKNIIDGDSNKNGIIEIRACFTKDDMKSLFSSLPNGTTDVTLTLEGTLTTGGTVRGTTTAHVVKFSWLHAGSLASVSPNPLNPQAKLSFATTRPGVTSIQVFDLNGRLVRNLMQRQYLMPGVHEVTVDGRNESGNKLASGVYYYRVMRAEGVIKGSFIVMK